MVVKLTNESDCASWFANCANPPGTPNPFPPSVFSLHPPFLSSALSRTLCLFFSHVCPRARCSHRMSAVQTCDVSLCPPQERLKSQLSRLHAPPPQGDVALALSHLRDDPLTACRTTFGKGNTIWHLAGNNGHVELLRVRGCVCLWWWGWWGLSCPNTG